MVNLLNSSETATIFLNSNLQVKRFTPSTSKIVHLIQSDVGRPIAHINSDLKYDQVVADVREVIDKLVPKDVQVESKTGQWYVMRIVPYRTTDNFINGAVITFIDITRQKQVEQAAQQLSMLVKNLLFFIREPVVVVDKQVRIVSVSHAFEKDFGVKAGLVEGKILSAVGKAPWNTPLLLEWLSGFLADHKEADTFTLTTQELNPQAKPIAIQAQRIEHPGVDPTVMLVLSDAPNQQA